MCGITGFYLPASNTSNRALRLAEGGLLQHRGPDGFGRWFDACQIVGLQHYRLAILDLSPAGSQPMHSADSRYVLVFNGEIYNHLEMRSRLEKEGLSHAWRGHSDTETILAAISSWGVSKTIDLCVGMFAFALFDQHERTLTLSRDRLGEKPLYYGFIAGAFCFASEVKALRALGTDQLRLHSGALSAYMRLGYVPGSQSIYEGIYRLPPGSMLRISENNVSCGDLPLPDIYWDATNLSTKSHVESCSSSATNALDAVDDVLRQAVRGQMLSDVPLGALLSGGIDSSLIVALMQAQSSQPVHTFSIGFSGAPVNEAPYARLVAQHLRTHHTEFYVSARDVLEVVPRMAEIYCEPFADSSQVPTFIVAQLARKHVNVVLTGDGGDELFGGYDRYFRVVNGYRKIKSIPLPLRKVIGAILRHTPIDALNFLIRTIGNPGGFDNPGDRVRKIAEVLGSKNYSALNRGLISLWDPSKIMPFTAEMPSVFTRDLPEADTPFEQMMLADILCYLPDDLLVKVDRAAMAVSLESRAPFLDHRVVEQAWSLGYKDKVQNGTSKWILRKLLERYLPRHLFERPKQGFGLPMGDWLRGPLREWAEDLLSESALRDTGLFNENLIRTYWGEHLRGTRNWQGTLWSILMFQSWYRSIRA
jgi:asparagine synthase (glutamine-hydrolysing)